MNLRGTSFLQELSSPATHDPDSSESAIPVCLLVTTVCPSCLNMILAILLFTALPPGVALV